MISLCLAFLLPPSALCLQPVLGAFSLDKLCVEQYKTLTPCSLAHPAHTGKASLAHAASHQIISNMGLNGRSQQLPHVRPSLPSADFPGNRGSCITVISGLELPLPDASPGLHCEECPS